MRAIDSPRRELSFLLLLVQNGQVFVILQGFKVALPPNANLVISLPPNANLSRNAGSAKGNLHQNCAKLYDIVVFTLCGVFFTPLLKKDVFRIHFKWDRETAERRGYGALNIFWSWKSETRWATHYIE